MEDVKPTKTMDRRLKWKIRRFRKGLCTACGKPREDSPYSMVCKLCGTKHKERARKKQGSSTWKLGSPGRPPLWWVNRKKAS